MLLIAAVDYTFGGGVLVGREQWTVVQIVFWTAAAYVAGQLIAGPSASLLEHTIARRLLYPPTQILLGVRERRRRERLLSLIAGRHYEPFPAPMRAQLLSRAAAAYATSPADFHDAEATFQAAYASARNSSDTVARIDQFRNLYAFSRNLAFVGLIAAILLGIRAYLTPTTEIIWLLIAAVVLAIGMFGRFIKFYSAFAAEVLRTYSKAPADRKAAKI